MFGRDIFSNLLILNGEELNYKKDFLEDINTRWSKYVEYQQTNIGYEDYYPYIEIDKFNENHVSGIACVKHKDIKTVNVDNSSYHDTIEIYKIYFYQYNNHFFKIKKLTYTSGDLIYGYNNIYKDYPTDAYLLETTEYASAKFAFSYRDRINSHNNIYAFVKIGETIPITMNVEKDYIVPLNSVKIRMDKFLKYIFSSMDLYYYTMSEMQIKNSNIDKYNQIKEGINKAMEKTMENLHLFGDDDNMRNYFNKINYGKFFIGNIPDSDKLNKKILSIMRLCDVKLSKGLFVSKKKSTDSMLTHYHNYATRSKFIQTMKKLHKDYDSTSFIEPMKNGKYYEKYNMLRLYYFLIENFNAKYIIAKNDLNACFGGYRSNEIYLKGLYDTPTDFILQPDGKSLVLFVVVISYDDDYEFSIYAIKKPISINSNKKEEIIKEEIIEESLTNFISITCKMYKKDYTNFPANIQSIGDFEIKIEKNLDEKVEIIKMSKFDEFIKKHFNIL